MKKTILYILCIVSIVYGCSSPTKTSNSDLKYTPKKKLDSLDKWFANHENYNETDFLTKFYVHFNEKVVNKQWDEAAQLLRWTGNNLSTNQTTDSLLIQNSINFLKQHGNKISNENKAGINTKIAQLYYYASDFKDAIDYNQKAIQVPQSDTATVFHIAIAYRQLSIIHQELGKYDKALKAGLESMKLSEKIDSKFNIGATSSSLGSLYIELDDFDKANFYYDKAMTNFKLTNNKNGAYTMHLNKIALYEAFEKKGINPLIDSMYQYYQKNNIKLKLGKISALSWYSHKLLEENKIEEAKQLLEEVKPLFDQSDQKSLYGIYLTAALVYEQKTGKKLVQNKVIEEILPFYKEKKDFNSILTCYDFLIEEALLKNDYKTALLYTDEYDAIIDTLYNKTVVIKTKELDRKYQIEKKEKEIAVQKIEIQQKNTSISLLIAAIVGLLSIVSVYFLWQKQKLLKQEKTNNMNFTKQLLENTEDERKRIATDLHDSISHELLNLKSIFRGDLTTINSKIDSIINDVRSISRNLHPVMFDKIGLVPNIEQLVERIQSQNDFLVSTEIDYKGSLESASELQIYRIIQEALTNIIKYAKAYAAKITILEESENIKIEIKDNGKGFNVKETLNSGKAFGLHNIIERSRVIGGEVQIHSSSAGTIINIIIHKKA